MRIVPAGRDWLEALLKEMSFGLAGCLFRLRGPANWLIS